MEAGPVRTYQIAVRLAQLDLNASTQHVEDQLRCCACLHSGAACHDLRSGHGLDHMIDISTLEHS